jgi:hypothetical protein
VQLLIDFVSGRPDKNLSKLEMPDPADANKKMSASEVVRRVAEMRYPDPAKQTRPSAEDASFLLLAKDHLSALAAPARGLTIAYTAMFVATAQGGLLRRALRLLRPQQDPQRSQPGADPYSELAIRAFPALEAHATSFRLFYIAFLWLSLALIFITAWTYWGVAFGNSIIDRLHFFDKERATILQAHDDAEVKCVGSATLAALRKTGEASEASGSNAARIPCQRLQEISEGKMRAHNDLLQLIRCGGASCSPPLHMLRWDFMVDNFFSELKLYQTADAVPQPNAGAAVSRSLPAPEDREKINAADQSIESVLSVYSTYVLPLMFGVLGTMIGAIREIRDKIRGGELAPRDAWMLVIGLPMGALAGLAVGLFFSPSDAAVSAAGGSVGKLTLSTIALGFLAGYGSESFFTFVDNLFRQVFRTRASEASSGPGSAARAV